MYYLIPTTALWIGDHYNHCWPHLQSLKLGHKEIQEYDKVAPVKTVEAEVRDKGSGVQGHIKCLANLPCLSLPETLSLSFPDLPGPKQKYLPIYFLMSRNVRFLVLSRPVPWSWLRQGMVLGLWLMSSTGHTPCCSSWNEPVFSWFWLCLGRMRPLPGLPGKNIGALVSLCP